MVSIVAIVAIVGIVLLVLSMSPGETTISETGEDANNKNRKSNEITPKQLGVYLAEIFKCKNGDNWWTEQDRSIQDKVKLPKK